ncbi:ThuA domain-containing protein [Croceicoccus sp. BE223]|uniref:ThuA domain-containing protein n=1 Tax=Croceicoccus sp. BE223 TaxID=2817716 RepID=UPI002864202F|nr:ThuA domain-containing protein [Croceicoccus sp. BE223]MDR7101884.1 type 1 glutamine amidotransferase [Croceicoccus sp. BE223]
MSKVDHGPDPLAASTAKDHPARIDCVLIAGGEWHDIDFARLELLKLLAEDPRVRTRVFEDYENLEAIRGADILISYTCNVVPSHSAQETLRDWVEAGGRWYALHGTNSILKLMDDGLFHALRDAPLFMDVLGSQFLTHPPIAPYTVTVADPDHELTRGVEAFETTDELYHLETHGDLHVLLETECTEPGTGFAEAADAPGIHPVMYIKRRGAGAVLYNTLGHCRGHYDLQPLADWWPTVDRCAWELPVFYDLLRRGIGWIKTKD